jgi:hypothetical protein
MTEIKRTAVASDGGISLGEAPPRPVPEEQAPELELRPESIDLQLPNGKIVTLGTPKTGTMLLLARLMGVISPDRTDPVLLSFLKAIFYVRKIDGKDVPIPQDHVSVQALSNELGDAGEDIVLSAYATFWPPMTEKSLPVVRKTN